MKVFIIRICNFIQLYNTKSSSGDESLKIKNLTINFQLMSRQLLLLNSQNTILSERARELYTCLCAVKFKHNN